MQIDAGRWIGIFVNDEAGAGVLDENGGKPRPYAAFRNDSSNLGGDFVSALAGSAEVKCLGDRFHVADNNTTQSAAVGRMKSRKSEKRRRVAPDLFRAVSVSGGAAVRFPHLETTAPERMKSRTKVLNDGGCRKRFFRVQA